MNTSRTAAESTPAHSTDTNQSAAAPKLATTRSEWAVPPQPGSELVMVHNSQLQAITAFGSTDQSLGGTRPLSLLQVTDVIQKCVLSGEAVAALSQISLCVVYTQQGRSTPGVHSIELYSRTASQQPIRFGPAVGAGRPMNKRYLTGYALKSLHLEWSLVGNHHHRYQLTDVSCQWTGMPAAVAERIKNQVTENWKQEQKDLDPQDHKHQMASAPHGQHHHHQRVPQVPQPFAVRISPSPAQQPIATAPVAVAVAAAPSMYAPWSGADDGAFSMLTNASATITDQPLYTDANQVLSSSVTASSSSSTLGEQLLMWSPAFLGAGLAGAVVFRNQIANLVRRGMRIGSEAGGKRVEKETGSAAPCSAAPSTGASDEVLYPIVRYTGKT